MSMDALYARCPLDPSLDEIRTLKIERESRLDEIRGVTCVLSKAPLATATYTALSYMWAYEPSSFVSRALWQRQKSKITIKCEGDTTFSVTAEITANLYDALSHLRHPTQSTIMWIDQLCINQHDQDEKLHQLKLMGKVYQQAQKTVIWLGRENHHFALNAIDFVCSGGYANKPSTTVGSYVHNLRLIFYGAALHRFLRNPYFSRVWIVQEIALSENVEVRFGKNHVLYKDLAFSIVAVTPPSLGSRHWESLRSILAIRCHALGNYERSEVNAGWNLAEHLRKDLLSLLYLFRESKATNSEDKVYGLLGLYSKIRASLTFEIEELYEPTWQEVYISTAISILEENRNLDLFSALSLRRDRKASSSLPSWVPDWSASEQLPLPISTICDGLPIIESYDGPTTHVYKSRHDTELIPHVRIVLFPNALKLCGQEIDTIDIIGKVCNTEQASPSMRLCFESIYTWTGSHRMETLIDWHTKFVDSSNAFEEFLHTVTCGNGDTYKSGAQRLIPRYQGRGIRDIRAFNFRQPVWVFMILQFLLQFLWLPASTVLIYFIIPPCLAIPLAAFGSAYAAIKAYPYLPPHDSDDEEKEFYSEGLSRMELRTMARTEKGKLALVPEGARKGDKIVVCIGARCPLLLYKSSSIARFQIVGECYLHGAMEECDRKIYKTLEIA